MDIIHKRKYPIGCEPVPKELDSNGDEDEPEILPAKGTEADNRRRKRIDVERGNILWKTKSVTADEAIDHVATRVKWRPTLVVWWANDWKQCLPERLKAIEEHIVPHTTIEDSYKIVGDTRTLMLRNTDMGIGVFVDLTPASVLEPTYSSRTSSRQHKCLEGKVAYEDGQLIVDYPSKKTGVTGTATNYTVESESGRRRYQASGDGTSYGPLINEGWEENNSYIEEGTKGKPEIRAVTTLLHMQQVFVQYGLQHWENGDYPEELKQRAREYYAKHPANFGRGFKGERCSFAAVQDTTYDYDKWEGNDGVVCSECTGLDKQVSDRYITINIMEIQDRKISTDIIILGNNTGQSHDALIDSGANVQVANQVLAKALQDIGITLRTDQGTISIKTADKKHPIQITGWLDVGGYVGSLAVVENALYNLLSTSIVQEKGMGAVFPPY